MWLALWIVVLIVGAAGVLATVGRIRFGARVAREGRSLLAATGRAAPRPIDRTAIERLPPPVRRYLARAIGTGRSSGVRTVRLRHGGTFRASLDGGWLPILGEQYFSSDPPGFIWWGRVRPAPGVWIDARDRSVAGAGNMFVTIESLVTIANRSGPEIDQGALLRLLAEMTWFPTAFLDDRYVQWTPVDERRAHATLRVGGRQVTGTFEFGDDDLPRMFSAERYRDTGGGTAELTPFIGESIDFREVAGLLVPHQLFGAWVVNGERKDYVRFVVDVIELDVPRTSQDLAGPRRTSQDLAGPRRTS